MGGLFHSYIYEPILSLLLFVYERLSFGDLGVAIIILTLLVRVVLLPLFHKGTRDQALMQRLQPEIKKIQREFKGNKEAQAKELMALYKTHRLNPFSGILLLIVQLPIFIALFQIFTKELQTAAFTSHYLFGFVNLEEKSIPLAIIAAALQYVQGKLAMPPQKNENESAARNNPLAQTGKIMLYIGPLLTLFILNGLPAALGVYWSVSTVFSIGQQYFINKKLALEREKPGQSGKNRSLQEDTKKEVL